MKLLSFLKELRRRNVYKVATVYAITAWLLAQIINLAAGAFHAPGWVMQMVIVLLLAGFPIALILAWAFELTPEGFKRTSSHSGISIAAKKKRAHFNPWMVGLLILAVVLLAFDRIYLSESSFLNFDEHAQQASIAVLPFADFSAEKDQEYFADGISDELLNSLANVEGLHVAGRTSSFQFKGKNRDLREIGAQLGVDHILEGSVRKAGDQLRITAQLIKIEDGFHIWSNTYDRSYSAENIFEIQDEISTEVLKELKIRLLPAQSSASKSTRPTENIEAYNLYLKGLSKSATLNPADLESAGAYFEKATQLDPKFALAYAKKAEALIFQNVFGNADFQETIEQSRRAIDMALLLQEDLAEAYVALGMNHMIQNDRKTSLFALRKAKKLAPGNAEISANYGVGLWENNKREEAQEELEYAHKLDPLSPLVNLYLGEIYQMNGSYDKAEEHLLTAIKIQPDYLVAYESLANLYGAELGQHDKALITMHKAYTKAAEKSKAVGFIFFPAVDLQLFGLAENALQELKTNFPNNRQTMNAEIYWLTHEKKFLEAVKLVEDFDAHREKLPDPVFVQNVANLALAADEDQYALEIIKTRTPEVLRTDTVSFKERNYYNTLTAVVALRRSGDRKKADIILKNLDEHLKALPKEETQEFKSRYYWHYLQCQGLMNNKKAVKRALQTRVENGNIIGHHMIYGFENDLFYGLSPEELHSFKEAEKKIIQEQRNNVIAYLKKEGEWQEEWEL